MTTETGSGLKDLVARALDAASAAGNDAELKKVAFERVLQHLLRNGNGQAGAPAPPEQEREPDAEPVDSSLASEQQRVDAVARYFQIEPAQVREIFDLSGEEPTLSVNSRKLPREKAKASQDIALLIGGVRTAIALETGTSHIRAAADSYGRLDSTNFMTTLGKMDGIAVLGKPRSTNRLVRMKAIGAEAARALAQKLVS